METHLSPASHLPPGVAALRFSINISTLWHNKTAAEPNVDPDAPGNKALYRVRSFRLHSDISLMDLRAAILAGHAWTPAAFKDGTRSAETFLRGHFLVADVDAGGHTLQALRAHPVIGRAWMIHATPSYTVDAPRWRVVFVMAQPITDLDTYKAARAGLVQSINLDGVDRASKVVSQMFAGSTIASSPGLMDCADNILTATEVAAFVETGQPAPAPVYERPAQTSAAWDAYLRDIEAELSRRAGRPLRYNAGGWSIPNVASPHCNHEHDATRPGGNWNSITHSFTCHKCGDRSWNALETGAALGITYAPLASPSGEAARARRHKGSRSAETKRRTAPNVQQRPPEADPLALIPTDGKFHRDFSAIIDPYTGQPTDRVRVHTINETYFTPDSIPAGWQYVLLVGDMGTGKTECVKELAAGRPMLAITHLKRLVGSHADRLGIETYVGGVENRNWKDTELRYFAENYGLAIAAPSLPRLINNGRVSSPGLVFIDESTAVLRQLVGGMLKRRAPAVQQAYSAIFNDPRNRVVMADASADREYVMAQLALMPPSAVLHIVHNTRVRPRNDLEIYEHKDAAIAAGMASLAHGKITGWACTSKKQSNLLHALITANGWRNLNVTRDTARGAEQGVFLAAMGSGDVKAQAAILAQYDSITYTPVMGEGIDIQAEFDTAVGLGTYHISRPLHTSGFNQSINRPRRIKRMIVYVQPTRGYYDVDQLGIDMFDRADAVGRSDDAFNGGAWTTAIERMVARDYKAFNAYRENVYRNLQGYSSIRYDPSRDKEISERLRAIREATAAHERMLTLTIAPIDPDEYDKRKRADVLTYEDELALNRWQIEAITGMPLSDNPDHYDLLGTRAQRLALTMMTALIYNDGIIPLSLDAADQKRTYSAIRADRRAFKMARDTLLAGRSIVEVDQLVRDGQYQRDEAGLAADQADASATVDNVRKFITRGQHISANPYKIFGRLMGLFGLKVARKQVRGADPTSDKRDGRGKRDTRGMVYTVDAASWATQFELAVRFGRNIHRRAAEMIEVSTNSIVEPPYIQSVDTPYHTPEHTSRWWGTTRPPTPPAPVNAPLRSIASAAAFVGMGG